MIGSGYWYTGITLTPKGERHGQHEWAVHLDFYDDGFCDLASTQGRLDVRYVVTDVVQAARTLKADADRLGFQSIGAARSLPFVYVAGDGEESEIDYPANWREVAADVAAALGWNTYAPTSPTR